MNKRSQLGAFLTSVLVTAAPTAAQGMTWIVDQNSGPGSHFTDLPPAVAAASDGDTVVIRSGTYAGFTTGKALTVLGQNQSSVTILRPSTGAPTAVIEVMGLATGKTFVMKGVSV